MTKTNIVTASTLAGILITASVITLVAINHKPPSTTQVQGAHTAQQQTGVVSFAAVKGKNVLDQLKNHAAVVTQNSSYGPLVTSINGQSQGNGKYWGYYVDGKLAQVGAADYITNGGEQITWKLE